MHCGCGHRLDHIVGEVQKIRTRMLLLKSIGDDMVMACVCPSCKEDVVIGLILEKHQTSVDTLSKAT